MKVSIDGLRRSLVTDYNKVIRAFLQIQSGKIAEDWQIKEVNQQLWNLRQMIGGLLCVYSADPDDMFSNMADEADELLEPGTKK